MSILCLLGHDFYSIGELCVTRHDGTIVGLVCRRCLKKVYFRR